MKHPTPTVGTRDTPLTVLALPALLFFLVFAVGPLFGVLILSFTRWDGIGALVPVGLETWRSVLHDPTTWNALGLTLLTMGITWAVQTPLAILLGTFLAGHQRYRAVIAVFYFLPLLLSSAAIAIAFKALLDPNFGLGVGLRLPILTQDWLGVQLAFPVVLTVIAWQFIPFHTLLYQGGVRQIPQVLYEAAAIDGASRVRQFFYITLPQLKYTIITSSTLMLVGSLTYFDLVFVMTEGGPGNATRILALDMYIRGFRANQMGAASAIAVLLVVLGLGVALGVQRLGGRDKTASQLEGAL